MGALGDIVLTLFIAVMLLPIRMNKISIPVIVLLGIYLPHIWFAAIAKWIMQLATEN